IYPEEGVASVNELVVPAGVPVHFSLTSASVMNMFFVPQLGSMIATMNGMVTQLHLAADKSGEVYGEFAQYSGGGFSDMNFTVRAVPKDAFAQWIATARQSGSALDRTSYLALCQQSSNVRPFTFRSVDANLFNAVVNQQLPPCPGPNIERAGATGSPRPERRHVRQTDLGRHPVEPTDPARCWLGGGADHPRDPRLGRAQGLSALPLA